MRTGGMRRGGIATLVVDGRPAAQVEIAASLRARARGLLGRDGISGAMLLTPATSVHMLGMRFPIDVAYLSRDFRVLAVRRMRPWSLGWPRLRSRHVLEAEAGSFGAWGLRRGSVVEIQGCRDPVERARLEEA